MSRFKPGDVVYDYHWEDLGSVYWDTDDKELRIRWYHAKANVAASEYEHDKDVEVRDTLSIEGYIKIKEMWEELK